jgi:hypothetical protein
VHLVRAGFGEQTGDQRADFTGAENEHFVHEGPREKPVI